MKVKKFCDWLGKEAVNIQLNKKLQHGEEAKLFLRWVHFFGKHLNNAEKLYFNSKLPIIESHMEEMYDKLEWEDIKKALKEVKTNGTEM